MKTDFYTKMMLTLIALFLAVLSFEKVYGVAVRNAEAKEPPQWECAETVFWRFSRAYDSNPSHPSEKKRTSHNDTTPDRLANQRGWTVMVPFGEVASSVITSSKGDLYNELFVCGHK